MSKWNRPIRRVNWGQRVLANYRQKPDRQSAGPWSPVCGDNGIYLAGGSRVTLRNAMWEFGGLELVRPTKDDAAPKDNVSVVLTMSGGIITDASLGGDWNGSGVIYAEGTERLPENVIEINFVIASFTDDIVGQDWMQCGNTTVVRRCFNAVRIVETCEGFEILQGASQIA